MAKSVSKKSAKGKIKVLKDGRLKVFLAVKGLVKDGKLVASLIKKERPDVLALGIAPEELVGLRDLMKSDEEYDPELSNIDIAYANHLSEFGDVEAPPPCFTMAIAVADEEGIEVRSLDLDCDIHTDIYVKNVLFSDLLRQSMRFRTIKKKKFKIDSPEGFVLAWDAILNKAEGFSIVERAREVEMAESLKEILSKEDFKNILAVIEIERADAVISKIKKYKKGKGKKAKGKGSRKA